MTIPTAAAPGDLQALHDSYQRTGHRPTIDPDLEIVLIDCVHCHAQDTDPQGIWRPARLIPRGRHLFILCTACGRHRAGRLR